MRLNTRVWVSFAVVVAFVLSGAALPTRAGPLPGADEGPPELVIAFGEDGAFILYAIDNADPAPEVFRTVSTRTTGNRVVETHSVQIVDEEGHRTLAQIVVERILFSHTGATRSATAQITLLHYLGLPPVALPANGLSAVWGIRGNLSAQNLRIGQALFAAANFNGRTTQLRVFLPPERRTVEIAEAGPVSLELYSDTGSLTMRTTAGSGPDVAIDWQKLLAPQVPQAHNSHATPGFGDTSEFLLGRVALQVVLMESTGTVNTETWTVARRNLVMAEINQSLTFWQTQAVTRNLALSFTTNFTRAVNPIATTFEPITRCGRNTAACNGAFDDQWITQAMTALGSSAFPTTAQNMRRFANDLRTRTGSDWAFLVFVADSLNDADGQFSNNDFGYAKFLGGPAVVMTYDNDGWGIGSMDRVFAHELAHMFYALDEYAASGCTTGASGWTTGYLNVANPNCANAGTAVNCLMDANLQPCLSGGTLAQIAWRDGDADQIPDVLDTLPTSTLTGPGNLSAHYVVQMEAASQVTALNNQNPYNPTGNDATIDGVGGMFVRIDDVVFELPQPGLLPTPTGVGTHHAAASFAVFLPPGNHTLGLYANQTIPRAGAPASVDGPEAMYPIQVVGGPVFFTHLANLSGGLERPAIVAAGSNVTVAFENGVNATTEVHLVRSTDGGMNWSAPSLLSFADARNSTRPSAAAAGSAVLVVYENRTAANAPDQIVLRRSTDGGGSFAGEVVLATNASRPRVAVNGSVAHLLYVRSGVMEYRRSTDGGASWGAAVALSNASAASEPAVAANATTVHAAWVESGNGTSQVLYRRSTDGGATWSATAAITNASGALTRSNPVLAASGSDVQVFWREAGTAPNLRHARSTDGGQTWSAGMLLAAGAAGATAVATVATGTDVHLLYETDFGGGNPRLAYRRSDDGGATWTSELLLDIGSDPSVAADGVAVHIAFVIGGPSPGLFYHYLQ